MKKIFPFILFIFFTVSVSSCSGDTDQLPTSQVEIEEYQDGGNYTGRLESEDSNNN